MPGIHIKRGNLGTDIHTRRTPYAAGVTLLQAKNLLDTKERPGTDPFLAPTESGA